MVGRFISILVAVAVLAGCNDCEEPEPCPIATVEAFSVAEDSICFGTWEWIYTIKRHWSSLHNEWVVVDTIYPGEAVAGFETYEYVNGTVTESDMCFNMSGTIVSGCYHERNSLLDQAYNGPSDMVVGIALFGWEAPGQGGIGLSVYIPSGAPMEVIQAELNGLWMFYVSDEYEAGVRYRNRFIKTD